MKWVLDFSTTFGEYELHGVLSYHDTRDNRMDDDYLTSLMGGRRTFYDTPFSNVIEEMTLGIEYVKEIIQHQQTEGNVYINSGFSRMMTDSLLSKLQLKFSADSTMEWVYIYNFSAHDNYLAVEFKHKFSDDLDLSVRFDRLNRCNRHVVWRMVK